MRSTGSQVFGCWSHAGARDTAGPSSGTWGNLPFAITFKDVPLQQWCGRLVELARQRGRLLPGDMRKVLPPTIAADIAAQVSAPAAGEPSAPGQEC